MMSGGAAESRTGDGRREIKKEESPLPPMQIDDGATFPALISFPADEKTKARD